MPEMIEAGQLSQMQRHLLESIVLGSPLDQTLDQLCSHVEELVPGATCLVMLLNDDGVTLSLGAGPSATDAIRAELDGLMIGENAGSCGTAAYTGKPVVAEDTKSDPRWATLQDAADKLGIRACWSYPLLAVRTRTAIGSFAVCHSQPARFETDHRLMLETASHLAGIAIQLAQSERALKQESEEAIELEMAIRNAIPGIARLDESDRYVMVRERYAEILGYEPGEMIGMHVSKTIHPDDLPASLAGFDTLRTVGRAETEVRGVRKDGTTFNKRCLLVAATSDPQQANGYYCFMDDITKLKQAEVDNAKLEDRLRQSHKLEAVGTLASGVAHDFNNILTAINGYAEMAKESLPVAHPARESIELLEQAADQASGVTRSLLTFSHRAPCQKARIDLVSVINDSTRLLRHLLPASIELSYVIDASEPVWVRADATQLQQILMNLAINARDAMETRGQLQIRLTVSPAGENDVAEFVLEREHAVLAVQDNGHGMQPEVASRVFEPFFTTKLRGKGTGLGLSVVHGIVADHQGQIGVESTPGIGTTFTVCLPTCDPSTCSDSTEACSPLANARGGLILLAEDNPHVGDLLVRALESAGYHVLLTCDGEDAVRVFREHQDQAQLVVLDIDLPKRSGLACATLIRESRPQIPILMITGNVHQLAQADLTGNERLLAKPFKVAELLKLVDAFIKETTG